MCPPLSKWLFGIPEQDRGTLEQEARRVAGHSRRIWIKGKGQPNVEEDLKLKLAFIHSLHFLTSRASKHPLQWNYRPLSPVLRAHDLQNAMPGDQRGERRWRALKRDPLFDCRPLTLGASDRIAQGLGVPKSRALKSELQAMKLTLLERKTRGLGLLCIELVTLLYRYRPEMRRALHIDNDYAAVTRLT
jgi:hypothetical protein